MAGNHHKHCHDKEFDACAVFETFIGVDKMDTKEELLHHSMHFLYKLFSSGSVKGEVLIDVTVGSAISQIMAVSDYFKDIIALVTCDSNLKLLESWLKNKPVDADHSHVTELACTLKGQSTGCEEHEEKSRRAVKQIVKWDVTKENSLASAAIPKADCLLVSYFLEIVCKDHDNFIKLLKELSSLLKIGGHLILITALNISYYKTGDHTFSTLKCDEKFVVKAVMDTGFTIKSSEKLKSKQKSNMIDYEFILYVVACKERNV